MVKTVVPLVASLALLSGGKAPLLRLELAVLREGGKLLEQD